MNKNVQVLVGAVAVGLLLIYFLKKNGSGATVTPQGSDLFAQARNAVNNSNLAPAAKTAYLEALAAGTVSPTDVMSGLGVSWI